MVTLADRLREARTRRVWTQAELAEAAGVAEATIARIETARLTAGPHPSSVRKLAAALDLDATWLLLGEQAGKRRTKRP